VNEKLIRMMEMRDGIFNRYTALTFSSDYFTIYWPCLAFTV